jgi:hypothetical protein
LTAGNNPVDIQKLVVSARSDNAYDSSIFDGSATTPQYSWIQSVNSNNMLEKFEKVELNITLPDELQVKNNARLSLEIKPSTGAILPVFVTTPASIDNVMLLV